MIIKATAGGGGRGMRVVNKEDELVRAFQAAQTEAKSTFGNEAVYLERYFIEPRHIEVQVLADERGRTVLLANGIARFNGAIKSWWRKRHRRPSMRSFGSEMGRVAVEAIKAVHYRNAGTVEFLLDKDQNFFLWK